MQNIIIIGRNKHKEQFCSLSPNLPSQLVSLYVDKEQGSKVPVVYLVYCSAGVMTSEGSCKSFAAQTSPPVLTLLLHFAETLFNVSTGLFQTECQLSCFLTFTLF